MVRRTEWMVLIHLPEWGLLFKDFPPEKFLVKWLKFLSWVDGQGTWDNPNTHFRKSSRGECVAHLTWLHPHAGRWRVSSQVPFPEVSTFSTVWLCLLLPLLLLEFHVPIMHHGSCQLVDPNFLLWAEAQDVNGILGNKIGHIKPNTAFSCSQDLDFILNKWMTGGLWNFLAMFVSVGWRGKICIIWFYLSGKNWVSSSPTLPGFGGSLLDKCTGSQWVSLGETSLPGRKQAVVSNSSRVYCCYIEVPRLFQTDILHMTKFRTGSKVHGRYTVIFSHETEANFCSTTSMLQALSRYHPCIT